jgi:maltose O-acetyltransferase
MVNLIRGLRWRWFRARFLWQNGRQVTALGENNCFMSPVRGGGAGKLRIGQANCFGYWLSPRLGSGEILLQARSPEAEISIGDGNAFSNNVTVVACGKIQIGSHCQVGDLTAIYDCDFHEIDPATRTRGVGEIRPVRIGNNVWLGSRAMVLKGVEIGDNSVIGSMSLVTQSVPPNCLAAGVPARVIRQIGGNGPAASATAST